MEKEILKNDDEGKIGIDSPIISLDEIKKINDEGDVTEKIRLPHKPSSKIPSGLFDDGICSL